ncbi:hypothetical protein CDV55_103055 [Aspergillus turcosus]|nr:hypothetical protein CDV55_103055 [Aspergillus turcosus]
MSGSLETLPTATILLRHASRSLNPRIPPIARQSVSILPCRIAIISRDKLRKETSSKTPDLRRCVAHNSLLRRSMEEAHHNTRKRMTSLHFEDDDENSPDMPTQTPSESPSSIIRNTITAAVKAMARRRSEGLVRMASSSESNGNKRINSYRRYYAPRLVSARKLFPSAGSIFLNGGYRTARLAGLKLGDFKYWGLELMTYGERPQAHPDASPVDSGFLTNFVRGSLVLITHMHHYANDMMGWRHHSQSWILPAMTSPSSPSPILRWNEGRPFPRATTPPRAETRPVPPPPPPQKQSDELKNSQLTRRHLDLDL